MTEDTKPWYHGVKWRQDTTTSASTIYVIAPEGEVVYFGPAFRHFADLIAAAPETAMERDQLNARVAELEKMGELGGCIAERLAIERNSLKDLCVEMAGALSGMLELGMTYGQQLQAIQAAKGALSRAKEAGVTT